ncbi:hypothetical protein [Limnobacter litoralis]|uniref:Uncharacterized protein n=1 Tax=Limnobacter litoralis TaxID=481366 RepID=A0ABQ5YT37_9BURK|nr:hypothetical protein [Limnobacter litoralis]GLR26535.1 hypothetical protein GCM10007875_16250 [Limnobacter litoralis]
MSHQQHTDELATQEQYIAALRSFDWSFEYTEDQRVYKRAQAELARLRQMQVHLDPTGEIWMAQKPADIGLFPHVANPQALGGGAK